MNKALILGPIAAVLFAFVLGGVLLLKEMQPVPTLPSVPTTAQLLIGEEVKTQGTVTENYRGCAGDGLCYLRVQTQESNVQVIYHYGEWPRCINTLRAGEFKNSDEVEIFGKVTEADVISTCDSPDYYIKNLSEKTNTSTWQTYRNEEFGFELKYPDDWIFNELENRVSFKEVGKEYEFEGSPIGGGISISVEDMQSQFNTIEEYAVTLYRPNYNDGMVYLKVGGVQAVRLSDYLRTETVFFNKGKLYSIYVINIGVPEISRTYPEILSTFRFVE